MDKQPKRCMFCAKDIAPSELSMEHFVPKCLWEKRARPERMLTVPAHKNCNNQFSNDNEYFRNVMVMQDGAVQKCDAAKMVSEGTISRMFERRPGVLINVAKNLIEKPVYTPSGIYIGQKGAFQVNEQIIKRVLHNVMKGIFYAFENKPMPLDFELDVCDAESLDPERYRPIVHRMVGWQGFGDDTFLCRYFFDQRPPTVMACLMKFYQNRIFYGCALSPGFIRDQRERNSELFIPAGPKSSVLVPRWAVNT